ncbi:uncharacterized protein LOC124291417 [Haliotis rubra]|uniref:uncharacterized protein LOC124291417 n=1 Tax=Haliotis rubra TaxID=36100 RepID=UPI001EE522B3|nr:uncharacterized protein LOC124291417 [Haliotis rubra]
MGTIPFFLVIGAFIFHQISTCTDGWCTYKGMGEEEGFSEKIWNYVISSITWFDKDGYDVFDMCPEYPEPDWDLFEPEEKCCRKLSEMMNPYDDYWATTRGSLHAYMPDMSPIKSILQHLTTQGPFESMFSSLPDLYFWRSVHQHLSHLAIWDNISFHLAYLSLAAQNVDLATLNRAVNYFSNALTYVATLAYFNPTSVYLLSAVVCLVLLSIVNWFICDDTTSEKRVTFSNICPSKESSSGRSQRLARLKTDHPSKKDRQRKKKKQRQRGASRYRSSDTDDYPNDGVDRVDEDPCNCYPRWTKTRDEAVDVDDIDENSLRYIAGLSSEYSLDNVKRRVQETFRSISENDHDASCPQMPSSPDKSNVKGGEVTTDRTIAVYDIRYRDTLPQDVLDVLFCIDPYCEHDHGRYELRGCKILVKHPYHLEMGTEDSSKQRSHETGTSPYGNTPRERVPYSRGVAEIIVPDESAYSTIDVSPTEVHVWGRDEKFVKKYHESLSGHDLVHGAVTGSQASINDELTKTLSKQIRGPDALDTDISQVESFPDWRASVFHDCPYCKEQSSSSNGHSQVHRVGGEEREVSSSNPVSLGSTRDPSPVPGCSGVNGSDSPRIKQQLDELFGEALLHENIGPPRANSSFDEEGHTSEFLGDQFGHDLDSSQRPSRGRTTKNRFQTVQDQESAPASDRQHARLCGHGGYRHRQPRTFQSPTSRDNSRNGDAYQMYNFNGPELMFLPDLALAREIERAALSTVSREPVGGDAQVQEVVSLDDLPFDFDSVPTLDENDFNISEELQNSSLNESQASVDLAELNRSLSFYGDVSMVELAASWIVQNVLERVGRYLSGVTPEKLKATVLNISAEIVGTMDLIE